jgi:acyl-CoA reductase-like NAD-dependent aldehyde dehydrogenase
MEQIPIHHKKIFINNEFVDGSKGTFIPVVDPTNEQEICQIAEAVEEDAEKAVVAAETCFRTVWSKTPADERAACILRLADLVEKVTVLKVFY